LDWKGCGPAKATIFTPRVKATATMTQPNPGTPSNGTVNPAEGEDGEHGPKNYKDTKP